MRCVRLVPPALRGRGPRLTYSIFVLTHLTHSFSDQFNHSQTHTHNSRTHKAARSLTRSLSCLLIRLLAELEYQTFLVTCSSTAY